MRTILAAVDQSRHAHTVVSRAAELACLLRNELIILSVVGSDPMKLYSIGDERNQFVKFHGELIFKHFPAKGITVESSDANGTIYACSPAGIKIKSRILQGNPVDQICSCANEAGADLVIVGNRGLSNIGGLVLGSVSERVVHKFSGSVLVVRGEVIDSADWEGVLGSQNSGQRL